MAVVALGGCGEDEAKRPVSDAEAIIQTQRAYQDAFLDQDLDKACALLTTSAKTELIAAATLLRAEPNCPASLKASYGILGKDDLAKVRDSRERIRPGDVRLDGSKATLELSGGHSYGYRKVDGEWLISDLEAGRKR
jgi:hypothetical protein